MRFYNDGGVNLSFMEIWGNGADVYFFLFSF